MGADGLKDGRAGTLIAARLLRLAEGLAGDVASDGEGVSELRIHYARVPGLFPSNRGVAIVVLLCDGDKASQSRDIARAHRLAQERKEPTWLRN